MKRPPLRLKPNLWSVLSLMLLVIQIIIIIKIKSLETNAFTAPLSYMETAALIKMMGIWYNKYAELSAINNEMRRDALK